MAANPSSDSKNTANDTGKIDNASGDVAKEARGTSCDEPHDMHPPERMPQRNSDKD
ncbi:MAG: hypothetical protein ACTHL1_10165 [Burkholderiaceae bacterium]